VKHDCRTCEILRAASSQEGAPTICLACEVDTLMLEYYGNTVGLDISTLSDSPEPFPSNTPPATESGGDNLNSQPHSDDTLHATSHLERGMPIVASNFLATAWKSKDMAALAGNEQHDSHEFMQVFLDIVDKDCKRFQQSISSCREATACNRINSIHPDMQREPTSPGK